MRMFGHRKRRGAVLALVAALGFVLSLVCIAFIGLFYMISGSREGRHAQDSGTLNVAKKSVLIEVAGTAQENAIYGGTSEAGHFGRYSLSSINRTWGRCLIIMLNEWAMELNGTATQQSMANANSAWSYANSISSKLAAKLNDQRRLYGYFEEVAGTNSLRMFNADGHLVETGKWQTSCMNRGSESSLLYNPQVLPYPLTVANLGAHVTTVANGATYLKGYFPLNVGNGRFVNLVSFESKQQPHLVSQIKFDADTIAKRPVPRWATPVPNAFRCTSKADNQFKQMHQWSAAGIANTMHDVNMDVTNGFVRIRLGLDSWKWYPNYLSAGEIKIATKGLQSTNASLADNFWSGFYTAWGSCGKEYYDPSGQPTLYQAVYSFGGWTNPMYSSMNRVLLNRVNQIKPGTTMGQVIALMMSKRVTSAGDFVIGLNREKALMIAQMGTADVSALNPDVQNNLLSQADGLPTKSYQFQDNQNSDVNATHSPVSGWSPDSFLIKKGTKWRHMVVFTPGTGANGALLDIDQKDTTYAFMVCIFRGMAPPVRSISDDDISVPSPESCLQ